jgi:TetR/AcrR family transcriptional repressor of nem operon
MASSTKDQLIHEASRMLLAKGFHGFSLQELATSLNIKKASLFHYFPNKKSLAIDLYQFYQEAFNTWSNNHAKLPPRTQLLSYAKELTRWIVIKKRVCPVGALSLEWHLVDPEIQVEIKRLHELQKKWLESLLKKLIKESGKKISASKTTISCMALIQGSIQMARMNNEPNLVINNMNLFLKQF